MFSILNHIFLTLIIRSTLDNEIQADDADIPQRSAILNSRHLGSSVTLEEDTTTQRRRQNARNVNTFVYKYLAPKVSLKINLIRSLHK